MNHPFCLILFLSTNYQLDILSFDTMDRSLNSHGSALAPHPFRMVDCICGQLSLAERVRKKSGIPLCSVIATKSNPKDFHYCLDPGIERALQYHMQHMDHAHFYLCTILLVL